MSATGGDGRTPDGGTFVDCTKGLDLASLAEGSHTIRAFATDEAGNESAIASYDWKVAAPVSSSSPRRRCWNAPPGGTSS